MSTPKELTLVVGVSFLFLMFFPQLKMISDLWKKGPPAEMLCPADASQGISK